MRFFARLFFARGLDHNNRLGCAVNASFDNEPFFRRVLFHRPCKDDRNYHSILKK